MKTRNDFVSNSSSSSFICLAKDASIIELFNNSESMNLHEYLDRLSTNDFYNYNNDFYNYNDYYSRNDIKVDFVDDATFCKMFETSIAKVLPFSAKEEYERQVKIQKQKQEIDKDAWIDPLEDANALIKYVEDALKPVWGNEVFEYYEAKDASGYYDDENEESYLYRWFSSHNMKFQRTFNNH